MWYVTVCDVFVYMFRGFKLNTIHRIGMVVNTLALGLEPMEGVLYMYAFERNLILNQLLLWSRFTVGLRHYSFQEVLFS